MGSLLQRAKEALKNFAVGVLGVCFIVVCLALFWFAGTILNSVPPETQKMLMLPVWGVILLFVSCLAVYGLSKFGEGIRDDWVKAHLNSAS